MAWPVVSMAYPDRETGADSSRCAPIAGAQLEAVRDRRMSSPPETNRPPVSHPWLHFATDGPIRRRTGRAPAIVRFAAIHPETLPAGWPCHSRNCTDRAAHRWQLEPAWV